MRRRGFTLIELLVVLMIIGVMVALLLPAVLASQGAARRIECQNNLRQISLGMLNYHSEFERFPSGYLVLPGAAGQGWGWHAALLPFVEQNNLAMMIDLGRPVDDSALETARVTRISTMVCPSDFSKQDPGPRLSVPSAGKTPCELAASSYVASFGTGDPMRSAVGDGVFYGSSSISLYQITDGTSTTFLVGERSRDAGPATWTGAIAPFGPSLVLGSTGGDPGPNALPRRPSQFASRHEGGAHFGFADGSVRFVKNDVGRAIYAALATREGEEYVPDLEE